MSPDQSTEFLKALNQHNLFLVGCGIVWLLGTILQFLIVTRIKSAIENRQHFTRVRYDREMEIYREVWPVLMNFYEVVFWGVDGVKDYGSNFTQAKDEVIVVIRKNKPFFPKEIWQEVLIFRSLCNESHFKQPAILGRELSSNELKVFGELPDRIKAQLDKVEEAIRNRLGKFD